MKTFFAIIVLLALAGIPAALVYLSAPVEIDLAAVPKGFGADTTLSVKVTAPRGVQFVHAALVQDNVRSEAAVTNVRDRWMFWQKKFAPAQYSLRISARANQGFKSGPAKLTVQAASNDFRGQRAEKTLDVIVNLEPPRVVADSAQHYINQGGAELVAFTVSGYWTEAGVRVGKHEFRSFEMPGSKGGTERFSLFVFPWDEPTRTRPVVFARNPAGQEVIATFWYKLFPRKFRKRDLELTEAFIDKAVGELDPGGSGDKLQRFLKINGEMRRANHTTLAGLRKQTELHFLWEPPFKQLSDSKVEAQFADIRTYRYGGKKVDEQTHLGFDLSKTQAAPVVASNSGKVIWAEPLGIYGNCIVLDHGFGLQSIYAHLSRIGVKVGQSVERGGELGLSGATGLAGGDHLHFSMQIDGVQTNPIEWWDAHWIQDRIASKLPAGSFAGAK